MRHFELFTRLQSMGGLRYLQNVVCEACGGQAVRLGAKPLVHAFTLAQRVYHP
ncbi:MAG: hypothetical protein RML94_05240 [Bacteroidia bacterium]|nr:hypothetical protein [Bacteroidia bacterium]